MNDMERVANGLNRISLLAQLRDKVVYASEAGRRRCGGCRNWMKSRECPAEHNVNGFSRGPSAEQTACTKFTRTLADIKIQNDRIEDAIAFAKEHDLPVPSHLTPPWKG